MPVIIHLSRRPGFKPMEGNTWIGSAKELADHTSFMNPRSEDEVTRLFASTPAANEESASCSGWTCLKEGQRLGIVISCIVVSLGLLCAFQYYRNSRRKAGWARNGDNIAMRRTRRRQQESPEDGRRDSIVSRYTERALPTLPGVRPPPVEPPVFFPLIMSYPNPTGPVYQNPPLLFHPHREQIARPPRSYQPDAQPIAQPASQQHSQGRAAEDQNKERITKKAKFQDPQHFKGKRQQYPDAAYMRGPTVGQKLMQLFRMPVGRAETIASSRHESQEHFNTQHNGRYSMRSSVHADEHEGEQHYPIQVPVGPFSPDSNAATVYSDDYVVPVPQSPVRSAYGTAAPSSSGRRRHSMRSSVSRDSRRNGQSNIKTSDSKDGHGLVEVDLSNRIAHDHSRFVIPTADLHGGR
ncbi:hypothetical protein ACHAQH_001764 [Verticillium albo-atrum]